MQPFLEYLKFEKRYSIHTLTSYHNDLASFIKYIETQYGALPISDITHHHIRSWLVQLKEEGLTATTLNRKISCLKSFFKYCLKTGLIENSPMVKIISPKAAKKLPSFLKEQDAIRLLEVLSRTSDDWKSLNARMLITLFYTTGMRLSELLNLKEEQLDFGRKQVKILGKGNKERIIPIAPNVVTLIKDYIRQKKENFETANPTLLVTEKGKKIYPRYAWMLVTSYLGTACSSDKKSPHVLRHSFATHLMNNGAGLNAVKELLGHTSLASTQIYTHNTIEKLKDIHKKIHPRP